jgi:hypothetical protein
VVHTRKPQRAITAHALVPRHDIHDRMLQRVAHVQRAGNVWRRNDDGENWRARILIDLRRKRTALFPAVVVVLFGLFRVVLFGDIRAETLCFPALYGLS